MLHNFDSAATREMYAGPGRWNDPDMLAIGLGEFDAKHLTQARTHFSLWSILSAPLLMGFDVSNAPKPILELLLNREVIAINQDAAGNQGALVHDDGQVQILVKALAGKGERAVAVFNRGAKTASLTVNWSQLKLKPGTGAAVRDLWAHQDLPVAQDELRVSVAPRETRMFKIVGQSLAGDGVLLSEMPGRINVAADGVTTVNSDVTAASGGPRADFTPHGKRIQLAGETHDHGIGIQANSRLEILAKGQFDRFTTLAGVDDSSPDNNYRVVFRVYGDRKLLFESDALSRGAVPARIDLKVSGVKILELVADGGDGKAQPSVTAWANATLY
jgi:hypothetical protein